MMDLPMPDFAGDPFVLQAYDRYAQCVRYAHRGALLLTSGFDPDIKVWRTSDWSLASILRGHTNAVNTLLLNDDESILISTSTDGTARQWSFPEGRPLRLFEGHRKTVTGAALSPDESTLATCSYDARVLLFDLSSGALRATLKGHAKQVGAVRFSPDGRWLASAGLGEEVIVWSVERGEVVRRLGDHQVATGLCGWLGRGSQLVTYDYDGGLYLWQSDTWELEARFDLGLPAISALAMAPAGDIAAASAPHTVALFDTTTWERFQTLSLKVKGVYSVAWDATGAHLAASAADGRIRIWAAPPHSNP